MSRSENNRHTRPLYWVNFTDDEFNTLILEAWKVRRIGEMLGVSELADTDYPDLQDFESLHLMLGKAIERSAREIHKILEAGEERYLAEKKAKKEQESAS